MSRSLRIAVLLIWCVWPVEAAWAADTGEGTAYSPKVCIRTNSGYLKNSGSEGGTAFSLGALDLSFLYPIGDRLFLGLGYQAHFDFKNKTVPFSSLDLIGRMYVRGQGTRSRTSYQSMESENNDTFSLYLSLEFGRRDYYLGSVTASSSTSTTATSSSGNSLGLNGGAGLDLRLTRQIQLNIEANLGLLNFAASDNRYIISGMLLKTGIAYLW